MVEERSPAGQDGVDACRADDGLLRQRETDRGEDERARLRATHAAVERDQLFEGAALVDLLVVEAVDEQVRGMLETAGTREVLSGVVRRRRSSGSSPSTRFSRR